MLHKYVLLKTSWGIVVSLDMDEILNPEISDADLKITDQIYLRTSDAKHVDIELVKCWMGAALKSLTTEIHNKVNGNVVCYSIKLLNYNYADFQEEGLYCAAREWIAKYYNLIIEPIEVYYDRAANKYVFNLTAISG